ncbi:hypothetical protein B0T14DRAFT_119818 [Immersiella caudata]|uniref:Uncharacterized protein n=1 Tax=Immersiella caudata TaxID=314043 RepID=A0AA40C6K0_9PEZI|nr:hypothetical protein B0T14DRAFT_119818 [Immersiella caudata]
MAHKRAVSAPDFAPSMAPMSSIPSNSTSATGPCSNYQSLLPTQAGSQPNSSHPPASRQAAPLPSTNTAAGSSTPNSQGYFRDFNNFVFVHPKENVRMTFGASLEAERARLESEKLTVMGYITSADYPCEAEKDKLCDLNSTHRKAISHLFGRNKLCTRQVPQHSWVHFCRKHYQRCRYRNQDGFATVQAGLVSDQIFRVQVWSDMNEELAKAGTSTEPLRILKGWSLTKRKRESQRLDTKKNGSNKRPRPDDEYDDEDDEDDRMDDPNFDQGVAVEGWLLAKCGHQYTTDEMLAIAHRIHVELMLDMRKKMPDIEILPIIDTPDKSGGNPKAPASRRKTPHKRSQSMGVATGSQSQELSQMARRISQPNVGQHHIGHWGPSSNPAEKRQRLGEMSAHYQPRSDSHRVLPFRNAERPGPPMPMAPMNPTASHRPGADYGSLQETNDEGRPYNRHQQPPHVGQQRWDTQMSSVPHGPLPAPTPYEFRSRPNHQRSISDAAALNQYGSPYYRSSGQPEYFQSGFPQGNGYSSSSNAYSSSSNGYSGTAPYLADYPRPESSAHLAASGTNSLPGYGSSFSRSQHPQLPSYAGSSQMYGSYQMGSTSTGGGFGSGYGGGAKHTRHQSTPVAPQLPSMGYSVDNAGFGSYSQYPPRSQGSYATNHTGMPPVEENDVNKEDRLPGRP